MSKRTICIQHAAKLRVYQRSLVIENKTGSATIPLEDIWVLVIETHQALLTSSLLSAMADSGIGIIVCGSNHMPSGLQLPLAAHSRHAAIVEDQLLISKPLKKQLWQRIVKTKIQNQALCLDYLGRGKSEKLRHWAKNVASGDATGREAVAASEYFRHYLTSGTRRDGPFTAPLDYGYAILRAGIGREAVAGGWLVSQGIHHCSDLNAFNLVDDLLEPFRPIVDLLIAEHSLETSFDSNTRAQLAQVFEYCVFVNGKNYSVQTAIGRVLDTLRQAVILKDAAALDLPQLIPLTRMDTEKR